MGALLKSRCTEAGDRLDERFVGRREFLHRLGRVEGDEIACGSDLERREDRVGVLSRLGYGNQAIAVICDTTPLTVAVMKSHLNVESDDYGCA